MNNIANYTLKKDGLQLVIDFILLLQQENTYTNKPINIILLQGDVGMGKTHLVKEYCKRQNITISSPTFTFLNEYQHGIYHYDLYLKNDLYAMMRLYESLSNDGLHFVEWGDKKLAIELQNMGFSYVLLEILPHKEQNMRIYNFWL